MSIWRLRKYTYSKAKPRIQKAVEALKPSVPVADKKSTFWKSYMKLADEHDKEFKEKYGTDLDTVLIFLCVFWNLVW